MQVQCSTAIETSIPFAFLRAICLARECSGISAYGYVEMLPGARFEANLSVNYMGTVRVTKASLPLLRVSRGRVINMGSIGASHSPLLLSRACRRASTLQSAHAA